MKFKQAYWYHKKRRGYNGDGRIHGVVVHSMEAPEKGETAESTAAYFANGSGGRKASADVCFDSNSEVECVKPTDEAYHAPPASRWTRGYEHAGYARQSAAEWHDPYSWSMLQRSARVLGDEAKLYGFPLRHLSVGDLKSGWVDGVTTHNEVTLTWHQSTHTDPGVGFPMGEWLQMAGHGAHTVPIPPPSVTLKFGDKGPAVGFAGAMLNILAPYRVPASGHGIGAQLKINKDLPKFDAAMREAVKEFQRFLVNMWTLAGSKGKKPEVTGVIDAYTSGQIAYWVPSALKKA